MQGNLFETPIQAGITRALRTPIHAKGDPGTSASAGSQITRSGKREGQCLAALALVKKYPGCTSLELARKGGTLDRYCLARRLPELEHGELVYKSGVKICGISGKSASTWRAL